MPATKSDPCPTTNSPTLPLIETSKQPTPLNGRKPAIRLALSARGPRKEQAHHLSGTDGSRGAQTERQTDKESSHIETFYKTRYCRYFTQQGNCWKGADCQFAHSESELRTPPDLTKTRMCAMYRLGCCKLSAAECSFAHSLSDLKATDNFYKTEICSFWANGFCRAGDACRHAHGEEEIRPRLTRAKLRAETKCSSSTSASAGQSPALASSEEASSHEAAPMESTATTALDVAETNTSSPLPLGSQSSIQSPSNSRRLREKMLSSTSTLFTSTTSAASMSLSRGVSGPLRTQEMNCHVEEPESYRSSSSSSSKKSKRLAYVKKIKSPGCSSVGASTPETVSEDFTGSSTTSQTPRLTSTVFVPSPVPCFLPAAPWMYMQSMPTSRQIVGIPLDDALNDEGLDREGFCLGVPSFSSQVVTMGYIVGQPTPPSIPAAACASWAYPAPYSIAAFESHIVY